jgi:hypothetical protein
MVCGGDGVVRPKKLIGGVDFVTESRAYPPPRAHHRNAFCATPLKGRSLYVKPPSGLPGTTEDTIWVIKKTVYGLKGSNRTFYILLKKTILSFTSTER